MMSKRMNRRLFLDASACQGWWKNISLPVIRLPYFSFFFFQIDFSFFSTLSLSDASLFVADSDHGLASKGRETRQFDWCAKNESLTFEAKSFASLFIFQPLNHTLSFSLSLSLSLSLSIYLLNTHIRTYMYVCVCCVCVYIHTHKHAHIYIYIYIYIYECLYVCVLFPLTIYIRVMSDFIRSIFTKKIKVCSLGELYFWNVET